MTTREPSGWALEKARSMYDDPVHNHAGKTMSDADHRDHSTRYIALALDAARAEALDEAAKVCREKASRWREDGSRYAQGESTLGLALGCRDRVTACESIEAAIEALKEKPRE